MTTDSMTATDTKYAEQIKNWTTYTHYLAGFAGVVQLADTLADKFVHGDTKKKVDGALKAVYVATQGVDTEFIAGIESMQKGEAPKYEFPPTPIPDWPSDGDKNMFMAAWDIVEPALELWESKVGGDSSFQAAIAGLISAGDECVKVLTEAFGK